MKSSEPVPVVEELAAAPAEVFSDVSDRDAGGMSLAQSFNDMGSRAFKQGNFQEAIEHFKEALQVEPKSVEAHNNLGLAFMEAGNFEEARVHFSEVLKINPDDQKAKTNLDTVLTRIQESKKIASANAS